MSRRATMASGILLLVLSTAPSAQSLQPPVRAQVGGGAQWAYPYESSNYLAATPGFNASFRQWMGPHLGMELECGWWHRSSAPVGASYTKQFTGYNAGVNVLARIPIGRAAIVAGGGPGLFADRYRTNSLVSQQVWNSNSTTLGLQSLASLEVRLAGRTTAFGGVRTEVRQLGEVTEFVAYPTAGVRVNF